MELSKCCNAEAKVVTSECDEEWELKSYWYVCTVCGKPCDINVERREMTEKYEHKKMPILCQNCVYDFSQGMCKRQNCPTTEKCQSDCPACTYEAGQKSVVGWVDNNHGYLTKYGKDYFTIVLSNWQEFKKDWGLE